MSDYQSLLNDATNAIEWLECEDDFQRRRILYAAIMGLLNSISDVLDRDPSTDVRKFIQDARLRWKSESQNAGFNWFYDFIRPERNRVIHEGAQSHSDENPIFLSVVDCGVTVCFNESFSDIYWPTSLEGFDGQDVRDVLNKALDWWREELTAITT